MPSNAKLVVWMQDDHFKQMMGYGHAGLEVPGTGKWIWVTWNGSPDPINKACGSLGMTAMTMPAHIDVGFDQYRNRRTGAMQPNTKFAWNYPGRDGFADEKAGRGEPTTVIEITVANAKATGRAKNFYGLFTKEIEAWWTDLMTLAPEHPRRQFRLLSTGRDDNLRNCCATVVEALKLGGLESYHPAPTNILFQGSNSLVRWVRACQARIDTLLPQYHAARAARARADAVPWFTILTQIQQQCFMHLAGKPTSDRRVAVMGLAKQVLAIVQGFKNAGAAA